MYNFYAVSDAKSVSVESEKLFNFGTWQWTLTNDQCLWSEGLIALFDYSPEAFGDNPKPLAFFTGHVHPHDQALVAARLEESVHTRTWQPFVARILTRTGNQKTVQVNGSLATENAQMMCLFQEAAGIHIPSEEEKILNKLENKEQLLRLAEQNFMYGSLEWNLETDKVTWSEGMMTLFGYTPEEFGENPKSPAFYLAHIPEEDQQKNKEAIQEYQAEYNFAPFEQRIITKDGFEKVLAGEWRVMTDGKKVLCTLQDITPEKQKDAILAQQSALFRSIIDNSPVAIVLYKAVRNTEGTIVDFVHELSNPANELITGRQAKEIVGKSWLSQFPENKTNGFFDLYVQVVETGLEQRKVFSYDAHGIKGWFDGSFVKNGDGLLLTYQDISAFKHQQQLVEQANSELRRSNTELEHFAYVASHDLQEPLRKVKSFSSLLSKEYESSLQGNGLMYIQRMQLAVDRMQDLISDLLEYSRVGRLEEGFQLTDLQEVITNSWSQLKDKEEKDSINKGSRLTVLQPLPTLRAIPSQMNQLFTNLLSNALKFSRPEVSLHVQVGWHWLTAEEKDRRALPQPTRFLAIEVHDNGIGFDAEYNEKIFGLFQRLHGRSEYEGSGIGLAICKRIMENHGGLIQASGQAGEGATFRMYFPYEPPS